MRVGREVQRQVLAEDLKRRKSSPLQMSEEDRKRLYDSLMTLPRDRQIPALRSAGLMDEADALEQQRAEEHLEEMRNEKLAAINALPVEERMVELIANGFTDEAKALSEQLAAEKEAEDDAKVEEQTEELPDVVEKSAEPEVKEEAPKKKGRPKKQKK